MIKICSRRFIFNQLNEANKNFATNKKSNIHGLSAKPDSKQIQYDYIGPPNKESNLRPIVRAQTPNETGLGTRFRQRSHDIENWNQEFWARHNKRFYDEKEEFVSAHTNSGTNEISPDQMSIFYKKFLDKNKKLHFYYNISWYMKNLDLLLLSTQLKLQKLYYKFKK